MVMEMGEPGGSKLTNMKLRSKPVDNDGASAAKEVSTDSAAGVVDDPSKPRKTFGRTPDGTSNYSFLSRRSFGLTCVFVFSLCRPPDP